MASIKNANENKKRILAIREILYRNTDEEHGITRKEIQSKLETQGFNPVQDETIISDIEILSDYGINIDKGWDKGTRYTYRVINRVFDFVEFKVIIECLNAARFITREMTENIIEKLMTYASIYQERALIRDVSFQNDFKAQNNKVLYSENEIYEAILKDKRIEFYYIYHTADKKQHYKHDDLLYQVSPGMFVYDKEKFYLAGYCHNDNIIKHFRIDRMDKVRMIGMARAGIEKIIGKSPFIYANKYFGMFDGMRSRVTFEIQECLVDVFLDRFGSSITFKKSDWGLYTVDAEVVVSPQFVGWICGLGVDVKVLGPGVARKMLQEKGKWLQRVYGCEFVDV